MKKPRALVLSIAAGAIVGSGCSQEPTPRPEVSDVVETATDSLSSFDRAREAFGDTRFDDAVRLAQEYLQGQPHKHAARTLLVQALLENGQSDEAAQNAALLPPGPDRSWLMAQISFARGRDDATIAFLKQVLEVRPDYADALYLKGRAELRAQHWEHAIAALGPLARQDPAFEGSQIHLARAWRGRGETARADSLEGAFQATRRWREAMQLRQEGVNRSEVGELQVALDYFERAGELAPDDPEIPNDLGAVLARLERFEEAEAAFLRARELAPDNAAVYRNLANLYHLTGDAEKRDAALAQYRELSFGEAP